MKTVTLNPSTTNWRIGVIEDEPVYSEYLREVLSSHRDVQSVRVWSSAEDFLKEFPRPRLDLICVDFRLPGEDGVEIISRAREFRPAPRILLLTQAAREEDIFRAIRAGAMGCVWKTDARDILDEIEILMSGGATMSPTIALRIMRSLREEPRDPGLTRKEREVLEQVIQGKRTREIASSLNVKETTIKTHIKHIYGKFHVQSRAELVTEAWRRGFGSS